MGVGVGGSEGVGVGVGVGGSGGVGVGGGKGYKSVFFNQASSPSASPSATSRRRF